MDCHLIWFISVLAAIACTEKNPQDFIANLTHTEQAKQLIVESLTEKVSFLKVKQKFVLAESTFSEWYL